MKKTLEIKARIVETMENGTFDWESMSWLIPMYAPDLMDDNKYNWSDYSSTIAKYSPELINRNLFDWDSCGHLLYDTEVDGIIDEDVESFEAFRCLDESIT